MDAQIESILHGGQFKKLLDEQTLGLRQKYDLKKAELEILYFLSKCGECNTSTDIYHQLMMNKGHISQAVDSLCKKKYLAAVQDKKDRRFIHFEIQDSAKPIIAEMTEKREEMNRQIFKGVSEEEMQVLCTVSGKIRKNIEEMI